MGGKIRLGMIGTGFIGQLAHLMNYVEIPECEVLAIAEFKPILRREVATRFNVPRQYVTADELLADPDIDAVCVVTPRPHTGPTVLRCLEAGKHVISEKPMAGSVVDAERLVAAAKANNVRYVVGYMKRYDEGVQKGKAILDDALKSGELGEITYVRAHCFTGDSYCNPWGHVITEEQPNYSDDGWEMAPRWLPEDWKKAFHVYLNTYSHNTNLLRYLFGRTPDVVSANVARANGQVAILNFGEFLGTLETGIASNRDWDEVTEIFFTRRGHHARVAPSTLRPLD
ncbi:MAG: Gfo/Idh/MocA family oxidoreductase [Pseudomonadota bacterium]